MIEVKSLEIELISPSPMNPRKTFDDASIEELAGNIKHQGLLQPITVRPVEFIDDVCGDDVVSIPTKYEIVCGERRFRACSLNKMKKIPCIVREMDDKEAFDAMVTENLQRQDVNPIEEAFAFALLIENGSTAEDVALRFGKSIRFVQERLRLNALVPELKDKVKEGVLSLGSARLLSKAGEETQKEFLEYIKDGRGYDNSTVKWIVEKRFNYIDDALWDEDDFEEESIPKCEGCQFNTASCGCLFYEMNSDRARCTNSTCYTNKSAAYILSKIEEIKGNLLKKGDGLIYGKAVLIDNGEPFRDDYKEIKKLILERIGESDLLVAHNETFAGKCWYSEDDDRIPELLKEKRLYETYSFCGTYLEFRKEYYWLKKDSDETPVVDKVTQEKETLLGQIKRNIEIAKEKLHNQLREWANTKKLYRRVGKLTEDEQLALDILLLHHSDEDYLKSIGLKKYNGSRADYLDFIKENQQRRHQWIRAYIQEELKDYGVTCTGVLQLAQEKVFMDAYKEETMKLSKKLTEDAEKKNKKIEEKLKELGFKPNGEKL